MKKPKKTKKKVKKRKARIDSHRLLLEKIDRIKERVPYIEPTGECREEESGELLFRYTEAQHVFKVYREQCDMERLHFRPYMDANIQPKAVAIGNMPLLIGTFCIEDLETGALLVGWGLGMGRNRDWSGNTANTRALKQFLLNTFEATWEDPDKPDKANLREEVLRELEADGTLAQIEQIKFWAQDINRGRAPQPIKETQNDTGSRKRNPNRDSTDKRSPRDRARKKRDNNPGKPASRKKPRKR